MFQPMPTFFRPIFTNIPVPARPPSHPDNRRVPTAFASAPHGSHREPALPADIFTDTPTPHRQTLRGTKNHPTTLTVAGGTTKCHRWHNEVWQVEQQTAAGGTANCRRWDCKPPQVDIFVHHLPRKIATGAFQCRRWQRFLPTCSGTAVHLRHHGFPPATVHHPTCNGGWDTDGAGEAMPVWGL